MRRTIIILILLVAFCIIGVAGMYAFIDYRYSLAPRIKIRNRSEYDLQDVTLKGSGFSDNIGTIRAGSSTTTVVHPAGESGLKMIFRANNKLYEYGDLAYIESKGGYSVTIEVDETFQLDVDSSLLW